MPSTTPVFECRIPNFKPQILTRSQECTDVTSSSAHTPVNTNNDPNFSLPAYLHSYIHPSIYPSVHSYIHIDIHIYVHNASNGQKLFHKRLLILQ